MDKHLVKFREGLIMRKVIMQSGKFNIGLDTPYILTKEVLKEAVKNNCGTLPLTDEFEQDRVIGYINDLKYEEGKVTANVTVNKKANLKGKAVSVGFNWLTNAITECALVDEIDILKPMEE